MSCKLTRGVKAKWCKTNGHKTKATCASQSSLRFCTYLTSRHVLICMSCVVISVLWCQLLNVKYIDLMTCIPWIR